MTAIHIAFGDSAAGNVKAALKIYALENPSPAESLEDFVNHAGLLSCSDQFSIGPVYEMDLPMGFYDRINWIGSFLEETMEPGMTLDDVDDRLERISDFYKKLAWIENDHKVIVWYGQNVIEQIGIRLVSALLPNCELYGIALDGNQLKTQGVVPEPRCIAECPTALLMEMLSEIRLIDPELRQQWKIEWQQLIQTKGNLRIWENAQIRSVAENYFDMQILANCEETFKPAAEVIGHVLSGDDCEVCCGFLNLRVKQLVETGMLKARGDVSFMRGLQLAK